LIKSKSSYKEESKVISDEVIKNTLKEKKKEIKNIKLNELTKKFNFYLCKKYMQKIKKIKEFKIKDEVKNNKMKIFKIKATVKFLKNFTNKIKINKAYIKFLTQKCLENSSIYGFDKNEKLNRFSLNSKLVQKTNMDNTDNLDSDDFNSDNSISFDLIQKMLIEKAIKVLQERHEPAAYMRINNNSFNQEIKNEYTDNAYIDANCGIIRQINKQYFLNLHVYTTKEIINETGVLAGILNEIWTEKNDFSNLNMLNINYFKKYENVEFENKDNMIIIKAKNNITRVSEHDKNLIYNLSIYTKWTVFLLDVIGNLDDFISQNKLSLNRYSHLIVMLEINPNKVYYLNKFKKIFNLTTNTNKLSVALEAENNKEINDITNNIIEPDKLNKNKYLVSCKKKNIYFFNLLLKNNTDDSRQFAKEFCNYFTDDNYPKSSSCIFDFYPLIGNPSLQNFYRKTNNKNFWSLFDKRISLKEFPKIELFSMLKLSNYIENKLVDYFYINRKLENIKDPKKINYDYNNYVNCNNLFDLDDSQYKEDSGCYLVSKIDFIQYPSWIKFFIMVRNFFNFFSILISDFRYLYFIY